MMSRRAALLGVGCLSATACEGRRRERHVVATFSILQDLVRTLAGDDASALAIVGPDADAHVFEPTPRHATNFGDALLVVENGLGFEPWMERLHAAAAAPVPRCVASARVQPLTRAGLPDPHAWHDVANARLYVSEIAATLKRALPAATERIEARRENYDRRLAELDDEIRNGIGAIPRELRIVVTAHDAFGYFEHAYGVRFLAPLGLRTEAEPRPDRIAALIAQIRRERVRALFVENMADPRLIEMIARETGARIGGRLYSDALTAETGPAPTYEAMMRANAAVLAAALA